MARHRNIRTMNYDEEYDGYDDVYGHSVEDDVASSPSVQHFLYDRNHEHQMSAYLQSDIPEEDEFLEESTNESSKTQASIAQLGEMEQAKLYSCLDLLRDRMGDALSEQSAIEAILAANFDAEKALDKLLNSAVQTSSQGPSKVNVSCERKPPGLKQDITHKSLKKDSLSLSQLAKLNLSKENVGLTLNSSQKPKLADLAKINLSAKPTQNSPVGLKLRSNHLSLSELAKANLSSVPRGALPHFRPPTSHQSQTKELGKCDPKPFLNLSLALKGKGPTEEPTRLPAVQKNHEYSFILPLNSYCKLKDGSRILSQGSAFGRVMSVSNPTSRTMFPKYRQPILNSELSMKQKPFDFNSPSPDDLIRNRLRMA